MSCPAYVARQQRSSAKLGEKKIRNKKRELAEKITEDQSAVDVFSNIGQHDVAERRVVLVICRNNAEKQLNMLRHRPNQTKGNHHEPLGS